MKCPYCGTKMEYDSEIDVGDGKKPIVIYVCPNCKELAHEE